MDEYQVYYADYSSSTHGQDVLSSVSLRSENMDVKSIRNFSSFESVFHLAANYAIETYKALLEKYRPGEVENFCDKYVRDWMPRLSD